MGMFTEELTRIIVIEITGTGCCVAACDGQKVHDKIAAAFCESRRVEISFAGTSDLTPAFLNSAIGQLYGSFPIELIESSLFFIDIPEEDEVILKRLSSGLKPILRMPTLAGRR